MSLNKIYFLCSCKKNKKYRYPTNLMVLTIQNCRKATIFHALEIELNNASQITCFYIETKPPIRGDASFPFLSIVRKIAEYQAFSNTEMPCEIFFMIKMEEKGNEGFQDI